MWEALGVKDAGYVCEREVVWRGTRRTAEFVFGNVRDVQDIPDEHFEPSVAGRIRFVLDYPFDLTGNYPSEDAQRVRRLQQDQRNHHPTVVWLPAHFAPQRAAQLGRLLKINYLLERERLDDFAAHLSSEDRMRVRHQLQAQRDNIESQLVAVLAQLYGIARLDESNVGIPIGDDGHVMTLLPGHTPRLHAGLSFEANMEKLADGLFDQLYPKHPNFDPSGSRKPVTLTELKTVLGWITRAMEDGSRRAVIDRNQLALVKRIVHPLELGEVHDGPLNLSSEWRRRIDQQALKDQAVGDYPVERIRTWIADLGWTGLDKPVSSLIIAAYALLADRAWTHNGAVQARVPELQHVGAGYALRAQELPSEQEFARAGERAGALFGVPGVPPVLFAPNVAKLAAQVRQRTRELESAANGVRVSLAKPQHAALLGLDSASGEGPGAPRLRAARHAADLVERVLRPSDDTALIRELAAVAYDMSDEQVGAAVGSAPRMLAALDRADWQVLEQVRQFAGRGDGVGERAERLLADIARTAREDEFTRQLAPVLDASRAQAMELVNEALRLAALTAQSDPAASPTPFPETDPQPAGAGRVSLTVHGQPRLPSTPPEPSAPAGVSAAPAGSGSFAGPVHRVTTRPTDGDLERLLDDLLSEIRTYATDNPDAEIEIGWQAIAGDTNVADDESKETF